MSSSDLSCEQALRKVFEFIDRELSHDDRESMERHLQTCRVCFSRVEFERQLKAKLSVLVDEQAPHGASERMKSLIKGF